MSERAEAPKANRDTSEAESLREKILEMVGEYAALTRTPPPFVPGESPVPVSGKVIGAGELRAMVDASLDGWLTTGRFNRDLEKQLAAFLGVRYALTTNSGSSANLLAIAALASPQLGEKALTPGNEVITVAAGFPTTVNPMLLYGLVPVFVDVALPTYNIDPARIEAALSPKTKAIMLAHTLGNPYDLGKVLEIARKHDLWVVEDCCDALGSTYSLDSGNGEGDTRRVGSFGDIATVSFYPAHHITMGEGGAVFTSNSRLKRILESVRDWGRDCYCEPGKDNTCGKRFEWQLGSLPFGYDHKYTYSELGFNLKITDIQAACGLAQMAHLPDFIAARKANFEHLSAALEPLRDALILPERTPRSNPSWFGYPITLREEAGVQRLELLEYLDRHKVGSRLLFGGNLIRQPYMHGKTFRISEDLETTDRIMHNTFWIGLYPGMNTKMLDFAADRIVTFLKGDR